MKEFSVKKLVLCCIGLLSAIMLLVGLAFNVIAYDIPLEDVGDLAGQVGLNATGFSMLSFEFPLVLWTGFITFAEESVCSLFSVLFGVTSLTSLLFAIVSIVLIVLAFFLFSAKKTKTLTKSFIISTFCLVAIHAILSIVFVVIINVSMEEYFELIEGADYAEMMEEFGKFKTNAYVSLIIQAICFIAYFICNKVVVEDTKKSAFATEKQEVKSAINKEAELKAVIEGEVCVIELFNKYKKLYEEEILSAGDYVDKKVKLLQYSEKFAKETLPKIIKDSSYLEVMHAENTIMDVLKEYKKLLVEGVLSEADYLSKKVSLLSCIIK